MKEKTIYS